MQYQLKILIVEDEIIIADYISNLLSKEGFVNIKMAHKKEKAIEMILSFEPEVVIMDINLQGVNSGIELADLYARKAKVIFLTGQHDEKLMLEAFSTKPEFYLTKPIKKEDLIAAMLIIMQKSNVASIQIKDGYDTIVIPLDHILFVKSDNNYIDVQCVARKYSFRISLEKFYETYLNTNFIRVHRSYIVNKNKIESKKSTTLVVDRFEIPFSKMNDFNE